MFEQESVYSSGDVPAEFRKLSLVTSLPCSRTYGTTIFRKGDQYMVMLTVDEMSADAADIYGKDSIKKVRISCSSLSDNGTKESRIVRSILRESGLLGKELRFDPKRP